MENYQEKYAIGSLVKPGMVKFNAEEDLDVMGYFVTKVFLIDEIKKYRDGKHIFSEYQVVYPYKKIRSGEEELPEYDKDGKVINSIVVFNVYDGKTEAELNRDELNSRLVDRKLVTTYEKNYSNRKCRRIVEQAHMEALCDIEECLEFELNLSSIEARHNTLKLKNVK